MKRKDFRVAGASENYNRPMTDAEFWKALGVFLARRREELNYKTALAFAENAPRAPDVQTVRAIEAGKVKRLASLEAYCAAAKMSISDAIASVLPRSGATPEAMKFAREFDAASPEARATIRAVMQLVRATATPPPAQQGDGQVAPSRKPSRSERGR